MNWEEAIKFIRKVPEYSYLVEKAYFDEDLVLNVERFKKSEEFIETLRLIRQFSPEGKSMLDVGSGNGISAISFALEGYEVVASEPDPSSTVGAGAIRNLKERFNLPNIEIHESFAEDIGYKEETFDIIYVRQAMHHAYDLKKFVANLSRLLTKGGLLITVRDHVIYDETDKQLFLDSHPLHKYYGGENAFTLSEYKEAFQSAHLKLELILDQFSSVINYSPLTEKEFKSGSHLLKNFQDKAGILGQIPFTFWLYKLKIGFFSNSFYDETKIPGRMYSFITLKA